MGSLGKNSHYYYGYIVRRILSLLLIFSLMIVPMQHLLAAPGGMQNFITTSVLKENDHSAHHTTSLSTTNQHGEIEKNTNSHCKNAKTCKYCPDVMLFDDQPNNVVSSNSHHYSLWCDQSVRHFPELRPPRNA